MLKYWPKFREVLDNVLMYFIPTKGEYLPQNDPKWPTEEKKIVTKINQSAQL